MYDEYNHVQFWFSHFDREAHYNALCWVYRISKGRAEDGRPVSKTAPLGFDT